MTSRTILSLFISKSAAIAPIPIGSGANLGSRANLGPREK